MLDLRDQVLAEVGVGDQADNEIREVRNIEANNLSERLQLPAARDELYQWGETLNSFLHKLDMSFEQQRRFGMNQKTRVSVVKTKFEKLHTLGIHKQKAWEYANKRTGLLENFQ
ncbi:hypothetical protein BK138_32990 [Paenibacillus rhizosphaerae]|uniref:Uncharacterized protein n=1 Tax=Paenibacillus rhizosphaerae TaxID=297318 RepID=A0A1R1E536_9BACL|nr:hypothetical protein [Paenibacillus rhizosphaerae]OMF46911.1 hypothetical protein BK138_32990 [Paenibacillus rhizosphaerae]